MPRGIAIRAGALAFCLGALSCTPGTIPSDAGVASDAASGPGADSSVSGGDSGTAQPGSDASSDAAAPKDGASAGSDSGVAGKEGGAGEGGPGADAGTDAGSGPCTWGTAFNGNASFTWYFFGQGPMPFKGACGYSVDEMSNAGQNTVDTAHNLANSSPASSTYFAAIPGASPAPNGFDTVTDCGACVEITGQNGKKIVATVIDECPISSNSACASTGHLDLSTQAFDQLGYNMGNPSGTTWKFVPCPVMGSITAVENSGNQYYFQNAAYPIATVNGQPPTQFGYFNVGPGNVTITSTVAGQTVSGMLSSGGGSVNAQFSAPSGCY